ncbi:DEKNAAE100521 [Brettanomyces naardenensis]|uniref:Ribosome biogenesis regulatory protein n=1 Tax=Brettanomyces naardenensis TaxID=13370 RepID=A0A448YEZ2_BRENA|nr:DEKNAAE100521 [Brettanomyces naardenensis]
MSSEKPELKPAVVDKSIPVQYDMGNLALYDPAPLDSSKVSAAGTKEEYLKSITRDNVQLLINQVLSLPLSSKNVDGQTNMTLVELPEPVYQLPREKSLPKPKEKTKWEKFAEAKGIRKTGKKDKQIYDETAKEWGTKWGYKGKNKATEDQWLVEVNEGKEKKDDNGDLIDPRKLSRMERKKLVKKNMLQQKRNRERE